MRTLRPASATRTDPPFPSATLLRSRQGIPVLPVDRSGLTADLQTLFGELFGRPADDQRGSGVPAASPDDLIDVLVAEDNPVNQIRSEEHTSELQSLMRITYDVFCLTKKKQKQSQRNTSRSSEP